MLTEDTHCKTGSKRQSSTFFSVIEVENLPYFFSRLPLEGSGKPSPAGSGMPKVVSSSPRSVGFSHCSCARCLLSQFPTSTEQLVLVGSPSRLCLSSQLPSGACPLPLPVFQHLLFSPKKRNAQPASLRKALLGASLLPWGICEGQFLLKPVSVWVQTLPGHSEHSPCFLGCFPCPEA